MRRLVLLGIAVGLIGGSAAAILIPETRTRTAAGASVAPPTSSAGVLRVGAPLPVPHGAGRVELRRTGPYRLAARVKDPRGGPDWAVRVFMAERRTAKGDHRPGVSPIIGFNRCAQLGRIHRGRFGWLTADGTFRAVGAQLVRVPVDCGSRTPDLRGDPFAEVVATITDPRSPDARVLQTIVWGIAGPAARDADLRVHGKPVSLRLGTAGAVLAVLPPAVRADDVGLSVRYASRGRVRVLPRARPARPFAPAAMRARPHLAAVAPDPDGGLPFALVVSRAGSSTCVQTGGRVLEGNRLGSPDYDLDVLHESTITGGGGCSRTTARRDPRMPPYQLGWGYGGGVGAESGEDPSPGRIARRSPRGRLIFSGTADPEVESITFASPRDVRTVVPAGRERAFLLVYSGTFPTGDMVVTARLRNGKTRREHFTVGF